jgi:hypothetical protein
VTENSALKYLNELLNKYKIAMNPFNLYIKLLIDKAKTGLNIGGKRIGLPTQPNYRGAAAQPAPLSLCPCQTLNIITVVQILMNVLLTLQTAINPNSIVLTRTEAICVDAQLVITLLDLELTALVSIDIAVNHTAKRFCV